MVCYNFFKIVDKIKYLVYFINSSYAVFNGKIKNREGYMGKTLRILVVDDDASNRMLLQDIFHVFGYKVRIASNSIEARIKISEKTPDIVITDWQMPGISGVDLIKEIKISCPNIKTILMSGNEERAVKEAAEIAGANDFIHKPFHFNNLLTKVKRLSSL